MFGHNEYVVDKARIRWQKDRQPCTKVTVVIEFGRDVAGGKPSEPRKALSLKRSKAINALRGKLASLSVVEELWMSLDEFAYVGFGDFSKIEAFGRSRRL